MVQFMSSISESPEEKKLYVGFVHESYLGGKFEKNYA